MNTALANAKAELVRHERPVEAWLQAVDEPIRAAVMEKAAAERSVVLSYLFASALGMEASIDEWEQFVLLTWPRLSHNELLDAEIEKLRSDIDGLRNRISGGGSFGRTNPYGTISLLSRELRGHIEHLSKVQAVTERRALILAGVEITAKTLRKALGTEPLWPAIEAAIEAVWADVEARHGL